MADEPLSRRCSMCGINWKPTRKTCPNPDCGGQELWASHTVEPDEVEKALHRERFLPIVVEFAGLLWIPHDGLIESGQDCLESFMFVEDDEGDLFELQGHIRDKTGQTGGMWWVERVEFSIPDAPPIEATDASDE